MKVRELFPLAKDVPSVGSPENKDVCFDGGEAVAVPWGRARASAVCNHIRSGPRIDVDGLQVPDAVPFRNAAAHPHLPFEGDVRGAVVAPRGEAVGDGNRG